MGATSTTTHGQTKRTAWAILNLAGIISGTPPVHGTSAAVTAATNRHNNPYYPDQDTIRALAEEAAVLDANGDVKTEILKAVGL